MTGRPRIGGVFPADLARRGARELGALRVAPALCAAVAGIALVDGAVRHQVAPAIVAQWASTATTLVKRPWRLFTSVLLTSGPRMTIGICLAFVGIAFAEMRVGWWTTLLAGAAGTVVGTVVCDVVLLGAGRRGERGGEHDRPCARLRRVRGDGRRARRGRGDARLAGTRRSSRSSH